MKETIPVLSLNQHHIYVQEEVCVENTLVILETILLDLKNLLY